MTVQDVAESAKRPHTPAEPHQIRRGSPLEGEEPEGFVTRDHLVRRLSQAVERRAGQTAYLAVGLDNLALVNDTYGFAAADELIAGVGRTLRSALSPSHAVARVSCSKFGIVIDPCTTEEMEAQIARLQRAVCRGTMPTCAGELAVTVSVGAVLLPGGAASAGEAMSAGAEALSRARRRGANGHAVHEAANVAALARAKRTAVADRLVTALRDDRFVLAFQPIVAARTRTVASWECLVRLINPDGSIASAGEFIPVAEELGLVRVLDLRVLDSALDVLAREPHVQLAVNVSTMAAAEPAWIGAYLDAIEARAPLASRLHVELTEYSALLDIERSCQFVSRLKALGCRVAIDDFGAGYTSFRNLQQLGVDIVKIDGSFVANVADDAANQVFVRALTELARSFGLETVAEFVSSERDIEFLTGVGVDYLQGFYLGKPELHPDWRVAQAHAPGGVEGSLPLRGTGS